ncbi:MULTISPECIES: PDZ domain-containing protein [Rhodomicrobium]|uniref:PDZ domain-containing protein n=1 Tax=Rhodomicrobium TaxID=1068 RepID=UPI000B4BD417|nr:MULTISPECIES: PDZ domain-containing protein [Rhodomicrobium]
MKILVAALILIGSCLQAVAQAETGWFGVQVGSVPKEEADKLGWDQPRGAKLLQPPVAQGPADAAGLKGDDILVAIDGKRLETVEDFLGIVASTAPGTKVTVAIMRGGAEQQVSVTVGARPVVRADDKPQLMLETGGHMANVVDLAVTPDGKQLVSASNDKTVRVWDLATGKTVRIIRGETSPGDWGTIYAMALSAYGRWLAVGGYMSDADLLSGSAVRLYDFPSGKLVRVLKGHVNVVFALAFSADGSRLVSGSADRTAIVWDVDKGQKLLQLTGHSKKINTVAFNKAGTRIVTGADDESLRLWNAADGTQISESTEHKTQLEKENKNSDKWSAEVKTVIFSPDDRVIASGSEDGRVLLWDGNTGAFIRQFAWPGGMLGHSAVPAISFSPDGKWMLYSSAMQGCNFVEMVSGKEFRDGKLWEENPLNTDRPTCNGPLVHTPDGRLAAAGYNSTIRLLDTATGKETALLRSSGATVHAVGFERDSGAFAWGHSIDRTGEDKVMPLTRRMVLPRGMVPMAVMPEIDPEQAAAPPPPAIGERPRLDSWDKPARGYQNYVRRDPLHGSRSVEFKRVEKYLINTRYLEISRGGELESQIDLGADSGTNGNSPMGFTPDGQAVLLGAAQSILAFDLTGRALGAFVGHGGQVRDFAPSPDGRFLVSGAADQTVRLWNLQTRELIVTAFQGTDGEWVVWTPQGYFASSPNGDRMFGWQLNKGPDQVPEFISASQLRNKFYRPDIVDRAITLASATQAVEEADTERTGSFEIPDLAKRLPPKLAVVSPREGSSTSTGTTTIELALAENSGDPVKTFSAFVNDTKVTATARREGGTVSIEVPLAQGRNRVRLVAHSQADLLAEAQLDVTQRGEGALDRRNNLYIVAIGADKYPQLPRKCGPEGNAACDLAFAGADARAFADTIEAQMGKHHLHVIKRVLVNGAGGAMEPTRANIENVLDLLVQTKDTDTVAVFVAGHGLNDTRTGYQFLPTDARYGDGNVLQSSSVVKWSVLEGALQAAKGRRLLFVDTCRSTSAFNSRLMKDASDEAIVAFSATNTQQDALEMAEIGHGVFTNAVVKGLNGAADLANEREVRVFDLGTYVEREVRKLTKGLQTPDFYKKPGAENFVLARLTGAPAMTPPVGSLSDGAALRPAAREDKPAPQAQPAAPAPKPAQAKPSTQPEKPAQAAPSPKPDKPAQAQSSPKPDKPAQAQPNPSAGKTAAVQPQAEPVKPVLTISPEEEAERLKRGKGALALDDIAGARLIFEYLASRGSAAGAYYMAQTYDPQVRSRSPVGSIAKPDATIARSWYLKAAELGHPEAQKKIADGK